MLLPSVMHLLNDDYVSLMLTAVLFITLILLIVFCHRAGNAHQVISSDSLICAVILTVITRHIEEVLLYWIFDLHEKNNNHCHYVTNNIWKQMLQSFNTWYLGQIRLIVSAKNDKPYWPNYKITKGVYFTTVFQVSGHYLYNLKYTYSVKDIECLKQNMRFVKHKNILNWIIWCRQLNIKFLEATCVYCSWIIQLYKSAYKVGLASIP